MRVVFLYYFQLIVDAISFREFILRFTVIVLLLSSKQYKVFIHLYFSIISFDNDTILIKPKVNFIFLTY